MVSIQTKHTPKSSGPTSGDVLYWDGFTQGIAFETGIQRLVRRLKVHFVAQGACLVSVNWDPQRRIMAKRPGHGDGIGRERSYSDGLTNAKVLFIPEIPLPAIVDGVDPVQIGHAYGLRTVAFIHDLIPIKLASEYDLGAQRIYQRYYRMFAKADAVLATTRLVADDLRAHLASLRLPQPTILVQPLPAQFADTPRREPPGRAPSDGHLRLLAVSTWEPRKNLPALIRSVIDANAALAGRPAPAASRRPKISLTIVGRPGGFPEHDAKVVALAALTPDVDIKGSISDPDLLALYDTHHASVYPSCEEGFGLPILESLWLGRPCVCHDGSSMSEVAPGGGTLTTNMRDGVNLTRLLIRLAVDPDLLERLAQEIRVRPLLDWATYAREVRVLADL